MELKKSYIKSNPDASISTFKRIINHLEEQGGTSRDEVKLSRAYEEFINGHNILIDKYLTWFMSTASDNTLLNFSYTELIWEENKGTQIGAKVITITSIKAKI